MNSTGFIDPQNMAKRPSQIRPVKVGLIGLGSDWETGYGPVLGRLAERINVRAVYDPVSNRAQQVAAELGADLVEGVVALTQRADVQAVLILDATWFGEQVIRLVCGQGKPVLLAAQIDTDQPGFVDLRRMAASSGQTVMPLLGHRYTPATNRLQELMATRLGRPRRIRIDADNGPATTNTSAYDPDVLNGMLDWCRYIAGTAPRSIACQIEPATNGDQESRPLYCIDFQLGRAGHHEIQAQLRIAPAAAIAEHATLRYEVDCEKGGAVLEGESKITWVHDSAPVTETLTADRSATEVMLDQFCRRVVGGLVPVADLGDLYHNQRLMRAAHKSLQQGAPVTLNGSTE